MFNKAQMLNFGFTVTGDIPEEFDCELLDHMVSEVFQYCPEAGTDHTIRSLCAFAKLAEARKNQQLREREVKRNKQVDVPTEAWQKRIERDINEIRTTILNEVTRTEKTEETLIILVAYLSSVGLLDMNDWNKYLQISRK